MLRRTPAPGAACSVSIILQLAKPASGRQASLSTWAGTCASCRASVGGWEPVDIAALLDQGIEPVTNDVARRTATRWVVNGGDMGCQ